MTLLDDSAIIDLFFERSEQAIDELDKKHGKAVRKTASNLLHDRQDAEECANDAYLAVWNSIPPQRPNPLVAFVCRIVRNLAISRLRRETAQKRGAGLDLVLDEMEEFLPSAQDVEAELEARELTERVNRFLSTLSYDDRFFFVRRYFFAEAVKDIAAAAGQKESRVSLRLFRLREKLKKTLEKEGLLV